ncbi:MAG: GAF domain-containing protein [Pseudomonadota bacterium]
MALKKQFDHRLFTVLLFDEHRSESQRLYSSSPADYPVGGRKAVVTSEWTTRLYEQQRPFIGRDAAAIRQHFFDHELILSLGCESIINLPVVFNRRTLGTLNLLHKAHWFGDEHVPHGELFAALAVPALQEALKSNANEYRTT